MEGTNSLLNNRKDALVKFGDLMLHSLAKLISWSFIPLLQHISQKVDTENGMLLSSVSRLVKASINSTEKAGINFVFLA